MLRQIGRPTRTTYGKFLRSRSHAASYINCSKRTPFDGVGGYWAKLQAGRAVSKLPLPAALTFRQNRQQEGFDLGAYEVCANMNLPILSIAS